MVLCNLILVTRLIVIQPHHGLKALQALELMNKLALVFQAQSPLLVVGY